VEELDSISQWENRLGEIIDAQTDYRDGNGE